ncbi:VOC family protein [Luteolibacter sp. Populi]|uniref:VOC family protein n=1 Tax=Luteolibacter sp. Populi TaxID=3230487 RepID=UPI003466E4C3
MKIPVEAINHVGIVVTDLYGEVLGFPRHHVRPSWFVLNATATLHLVPLGDPSAVEPPHHAYRHVALQVPDLRAVLRVLLEGGLRVMQAGFDGSERELTAPEDPMDFGVGTLFVRDPDGNLVEFLQQGHGLFTEEMKPRIEGNEICKERQEEGTRLGGPSWLLAGSARPVSAGSSEG